MRGRLPAFLKSDAPTSEASNGPTPVTNCLPRPSVFGWHWWAGWCAVWAVCLYRAAILDWYTLPEYAGVDAHVVGRNFEYTRVILFSYFTSFVIGLMVIGVMQRTRSFHLAVTNSVCLLVALSLVAAGREGGSVFSHSLAAFGTLIITFLAGIESLVASRLRDRRIYWLWATLAGFVIAFNVVVCPRMAIDL